MCGDGEWSFTFPDDCCSPATRWSECRPRAKGGTSRPNTAGPAGQEPAAALWWNQDGHSITSSDVLIRLIIRAIADYAAGTTERMVAPGSRRGSHGVERRHPLLNIRRSCSAVSAPRCQAGVPPPFCSHGYETASPEPNPVRRLAGTCRPAIKQDDGATLRK